jgi:protein-tyrosine-phosphatase
MKKYLFICQHNFTRSRYTEEFFRGFLKGKKKEGKVYSAGLGFSSIFLGRRLNRRLYERSDCSKI